nr:MAG TPA: hypothetical protein [Crassvirales sp.]
MDSIPDEGRYDLLSLLPTMISFMLLFFYFILYFISFRV